MQRAGDEEPPLHEMSFEKENAPLEISRSAHDLSHDKDTCLRSKGTFPSFGEKKERESEIARDIFQEAASCP